LKRSGKNRKITGLSGITYKWPGFGAKLLVVNVIDERDLEAVQKINRCPVTVISYRDEEIAALLRKKILKHLD